MLLRLEPAGPRSLFDQLVFGVKRAVAAGELPPGERLPSVRELAKELTINPNTVAKAYAELESQGVIVRRQGAGCFVGEHGSVLALRERRRRLAELVEGLAVEAFHLGFGPDEVRAELERRLERASEPTEPGARATGKKRTRA